MHVLRQKTYFFLAFIVLFLILIGSVFSLRQSEEKVMIGKRQWIVELASTPAQRERGLGMRDSLPSGKGMLFLFPGNAPGKHAFWMKGMRFSLDIAWIRSGRIVFLERNIAANSPDIFRPSEDADAVFEVNAGELEGVAIGDLVQRERE